MLKLVIYLNQTMNNKILALKYRPHFFNEVVGQDFCVQSLSNSINLNKIHNAYLFSGTRGVGKTTIARIFAKSLLCQEGISEQPCGKCESCTEIDNNNNLDLIEIDAASRTKVEDTRTLMENVQYAPTSSRFKIYLIDEVHMLSTKSFNALLKTIEEPPEHVKFLLATTEPEKLPETVISRCLHFKLECIKDDFLVAHIEKVLKDENISFDSEVPRIIANSAKGSARDAMSILEQCISYDNGNLKKDSISNLLGIIDTVLIDKIILNLYKNSIKEINNILTTNDVVNYSNLLDCLIERIYQISISRASNNNNFDLPKELQSNSIKLEDLQLWYSILMQSKTDMSISNSKVDHLLMILLRITLFTDYSNIDKTEHQNTTTIEEEIIKESKKKVKNEIVKHNKANLIDLSSWEKFVQSLPLQGLMLDLAHNSIMHIDNNHSCLIIDEFKKNTYPKKCIADFTENIGVYFKIGNQIDIKYKSNIDTLYKKSINDNIKSKADMYESIKDNSVLKDIEDVFDAKVDKDNISKI